jgi:hypothetical protein
MQVTRPSGEDISWASEIESEDEGRPTQSVEQAALRWESLRSGRSTTPNLSTSEWPNGGQVGPTLERLRIGAIKDQILDADCSMVFTEFGVTSA